MGEATQTFQSKYISFKECEHLRNGRVHVLHPLHGAEPGQTSPVQTWEQRGGCGNRTQCCTTTKCPPGILQPQTHRLEGAQLCAVSKGNTGHVQSRGTQLHLPTSVPPTFLQGAEKGYGRHSPAAPSPTLPIHRHRAAHMRWSAVHLGVPGPGVATVTFSLNKQRSSTRFFQLPKGTL